MTTALTVALLLTLAACSPRQTGANSNQAMNANAVRQTSQPDQAAPTEDAPDDASMAESQSDSPAAYSGNLAADLARQLDEANRRFTYKGKAINPRAVNELHEGSGVAGPPTAISLLGTDESKGEYKTEADGRISLKLEPDGYFDYKRLGTLKDNLHVLETWDNGGGSFVGTSLLMIKFSIDFEYKDDGSREYRLVMQRLGEIDIADRYDGKIAVQPRSSTIRISSGTWVNGKKFPGRVITIR